MAFFCWKEGLVLDYNMQFYGVFFPLDLEFQKYQKKSFLVSHNAWEVCLCPHPGILQ